MNAAALMLLVCTWAGAPSTGALELRYTGRLEAEEGDPALTRKTFDLVCWLSPPDDSGVEMFWSVEEKGRGALPWAQRFGRQAYDAQWKGGGGGPALLYDHGQGLSAKNMAAFFLHTDTPLAVGAKFAADGLTYEVTRDGRAAGRDAWRVEASTTYGLKRTMWVDKNSPLVLSYRETVFFGRGKKHTLRCELVERNSLSPNAYVAAVDAFAKWISLRDGLKIDPRSKETRWSDDQLAKLKEKLPPLLENSEHSPLAAVAKAARQDLQRSVSRAGGIAAMRNRLVGRAAPTFRLTSLGGEVVDNSALLGKVTVLHFWSYREKPLEEPYGQAGYLDFLYRRYGKRGLRVYGVQVDAGSPETADRRTSRSSGRRFRAFMNLSYPLLQDSGEVLKRFGDPRTAEDHLPAYVVLDRSGKVVEYHAGFYPVDRNLGLEKLDALASKLLSRD